MEKLPAWIYFFIIFETKDHRLFTIMQNYINTCKEIAEQMKFDERHNNTDDNFDIDVNDLLNFDPPLP